MFEDLIKQGLVKCKPEGELSVFKYAKKVFFKNLWNKDSRLLETRGIVLDKQGNIVHRPFKKVFNLYENGTKVDRDKEVIAVRKVNGFMGAVTNSSKHGVIYGTTGSLSSRFADWVREATEDRAKSFIQDKTYLFEIVHSEDPHIIPEVLGVYLIGIRDVQTGKLIPEVELDLEALRLDFKRPEHRLIRFSDLVKESKACKHEGFMVIDPETNEHLCKIKSPHYLAKKFVMRMSDERIEEMYFSKVSVRAKVDEEFYPLIDFITEAHTEYEWKSMNEQERRDVIEDYLSN